MKVLTHTLAVALFGLSGVTQAATEVIVFENQTDITTSPQSYSATEAGESLSSFSDIILNITARGDFDYYVGDGQEDEFLNFSIDDLSFSQLNINQGSNIVNIDRIDNSNYVQIDFQYSIGASDWNRISADNQLNISWDTSSFVGNIEDITRDQSGDYISYSITSAVPEPSTYALMLAGLGLVGFMARRRKA